MPKRRAHNDRPPETGPAWHALDIDEVRHALDTGRDGLGEREAAERLARFGPNELATESGRGVLRRFLGQFHNVLIYILLAAAAITVALGHYLDASVIFGVVLINAVIGFAQEGRAERALDAIRKLLSPQATVVRDGRRRVVDAGRLVPGDLVLLQAGDRVPADIRLAHCRSLRLQEAILTGESVPVDKSPAAVAADAMLAERGSMAHAGTMVAAGTGGGIVVATGGKTEIGRVQAMLAGVAQLETPLLRQLSALGRTLTVAILTVAAATMLFGIAVHHLPLGEMFLVAVGLAVAAIPEGLPAIVTITLAIGVERMARRNAIIRRLPAVETLGSVTTICADKTGTFTRNEMMVETVVTRAGVYRIGGDGYAPEGEVTRDDGAGEPGNDDAFRLLARGGALCNDATLHADGGTWQVVGDPMEGALIAFAMKAGLDPAGEAHRLERIDEIPFEAERCYMATLHRDADGTATLFVKGAPERILAMCAGEAAPDGDAPLDADRWTRHGEDIAARGSRVIALACKRWTHDRNSLDESDVEGGLAIVGLYGLIDPPREEAIRAVAACRRAGIHVKMITGDHAATASAIAARLGLEHPGTAMTGADLDRIDDRELARRVRDIDVFARTSPEHKLRLVTALQAGGQHVAMTGDGVNDAPALKRADIGIAMGRTGSDAAKEAAEMVLADDNFASIVAAVEEGRTVYDNLKKALMFILPTNGGQAMTLIAAVLVGHSLPITPVQILWVNMITAVTLSLALAFEPQEGDVMSRPPRAYKEQMLSRLLVWRLLFVSVLLVAGVFGVFVWLRDTGAGLDYARTAAVTVLVLAEVFYLFSVRRTTGNAFAGIFSRAAGPAWTAVGLVLAMQAAFVFLPLFNTLFHTVPLAAGDLALILAVAVLIFCVIEIEKALGWLPRRARAHRRAR